MKNIVTRKAEEITNLILVKVIELLRFKKKFCPNKNLENYIFSYSLIFVCHYFRSSIYDALSINNLIITPDNLGFHNSLKLLNEDSEKIRYFLINIENEVNRNISALCKDPYYIYLDLLCLSGLVLEEIKKI